MRNVCLAVLALLMTLATESVLALPLPDAAAAYPLAAGQAVHPRDHPAHNFHSHPKRAGLFKSKSAGKTSARLMSTSAELEHAAAQHAPATTPVQDARRVVEGSAHWRPDLIPFMKDAEILEVARLLKQAHPV